MKTDYIIEVGVDNLERLYIKPEFERFILIYRTATEVHWDSDQDFLYSPKPREWSYVDWYKHIVGIVENECSCKLILTENTGWVNIPEGIKKQIIIS